MATSATNLDDKFEKLKKILECSICLERMKDPKALQCTHAYCKSCLDDMVQFYSDGSGVIACPLRCDDQTFIVADRTTNDLQVPVQFRNLMEMLHLEIESDDSSTEKIKCRGEIDCSRDVSFYCWSCSKPFCYKCKEAHNHEGEPMKLIPVTLNRRGELYPWCLKHKSICKYCCSTCLFVCVYCKQRTCRNHVVQEIVVLATQVKKYVLEKGPGSLQEKQKLALIKSVTDDALSVVKGKICNVIENQKVKWLLRDIRKWEEQEKRILHSIDVLKSDHYNRYPKTGIKDIVEDRPDFDIVLNKDAILQKLTDAAGNQLIPQVKWSLSNDHLDPLGEIVETSLPGVTISDAFITNTIQDDFSVSNVKNEDREHIVRVMKHLLTADYRGEGNKEGIVKERDIQEPKFKPVATGIQQYRVEKKKRMVTTHIPSYAWTEGEPTSYEAEEVVEELIPYEESYGDIERVKEALDMMDKQQHRFLRRLAEGNVETILIELIKIRQNKVFDKRDNEGFCLMHWAAEFGCVKLLLYILQHNIVPVDMKNSRTQLTPLHCAILHNQCSAIEVLIAYGADLHARSTIGTSAIDIARNRNNQEVIKILTNAQKRKDVW